MAFQSVLLAKLAGLKFRPTTIARARSGLIKYFAPWLIVRQLVAGVGSRSAAALTTFFWAKAGQQDLTCIADCFFTCLRYGAVSSFGCVDQKLWWSGQQGVAKHQTTEQCAACRDRRAPMHLARDPGV